MIGIARYCRLMKHTSMVHRLRYRLSTVTRIDNMKATVTIKNTQRKYDIDIDKIKSHAVEILRILEIPQRSLFIQFCSDSYMRKLYKDGKGKSKSTDILAFTSTEMETLGRIYICPAYVDRQMQYDREEYEAGELDTTDDEGVSLAMATTFSLQVRMTLLLVHGMIHLEGHDHETDEDWLLMVERENQVLQELSQSFPDIVLHPRNKTPMH